MKETLNHETDFLDLLPEIVFEIDRDYQIRYLNDACAKVIGKPKEQLLNKKIPLNQIVNPLQINKIHESLEDNFNGKLISGNLYIINDKDGQERVFSIHNNHIIENGNVVALRCIAIDVTQQERSNLEINLQANHYQDIFKNSPIAYQTLDENGNILDVNPMWEKVTGYSRNDVIGKNIRLLLTDNFINKFDKAFKIFKEKNEINNVQLNLKRKDNKNINVNYSGKVERGLDGKFIRTHCVFNDITLQKKAEQTIINSEIKLRELNATKDKFFSIIAHDLKNPFNDIMGFTQLLSLNIKKYDTEKIEKFVEIIHSSSKLAYNLLENLLDWSRSQTGSLDFKPEKILLNQIVNENIDLLLSTAQNKNINIYSELSKNTFIYADKNMVRTIIRNLLSNAIKYTGLGGHIRITNYCNNNFCEISISDNGIGISKNNLEKIFRLDESYSTPGTEKEKGTGLGLILCKEFAEKNGGKIWANSKEGEGSKFTFTLPVPEPEFI